MIRIGRILSGSVLVIFAMATSAVAAIVTTPTDLNTGDQYRLVFVTSQETVTTSDDITFYNDFVDGVANAPGSFLAPLATSWTAIASTAAVDARDNTSTNPTVATGVPIYLIDGNRVADDNADLWDGTHIGEPNVIQHVINHTELDTVENAFYTGTGTVYDGTIHPTGGLGSSNTYRAQGYSGYDIGGWIYSSDHFGHTVPIHMFAISDVLTVQPLTAIPEPSTLSLMAIGLTVLIGRRSRRRD